MHQTWSSAALITKILVFSFLVGAAISVFRYGGRVGLDDVVISGLSGLLIGAGCSAVEIGVLSNRSLRWLRQVPFIAVVAMRAAAYSAVIFGGLVLPSLVILGERLWANADFQLNFVISACIAIVTSTSVELVRLLGREATVALFTGRYRRPRIENRIVMFADLIGSTTLAEGLGDLRFHELLSDVSYDLSLPIERTGGETHRYVGDAVIVTWPMRRRDNFDRSVDCAIGMGAALARQAETYAARYGRPMRIRIALHCGHVAAGEVGYWKKEIALLGDTMNTTARIENAAREFQADLVVSDDVWRALSPERQAGFKNLPDYDARGKGERLKLWAFAAGG